MAHRKAELIRQEFETYRQRNDEGEDFPTVIADMIADLMHLGDALNEDELLGAEWDPNDVVDRAMGHYVAERDGDDIEMSERAAADGD